MPKNYRRTTVVSLLPFEVNESKPTLYPSTYRIPAVPVGQECQTLVIDDAVGLLYLDSDRGSLRINIPSEEIAQSLIGDYVKSTLGYRENCQPGLFYLVGDWNPIEVVKEQPAELNIAKKQQHNWFVELIRIADDDWSKFHQHKMISDIQRLAANRMSLSREWLNMIPEESQLCPMCRTIVDPLAVLCMNCKFVLNEEKYKQYMHRFGALENVRSSG